MAKMRRTVKMLVPALGLSLVLGAYAQGTAGTGQPGQQPRQSGQQAMPMGQQPAMPMYGQQQAQPQQQQRRDMRLSQLIGMQVRDAQGENLGDINDVIVDMDRNRAMYAVIGFGGFLGMGERLFAFPLQAFQMPLDQEDRLVLNVSRERLRESPGFDRNAWPDWNDTAYRGEVDRFYAAPGTRGAVGQPTQAQPGQVQVGPAAGQQQGTMGQMRPGMMGQTQPGMMGQTQPATPRGQQAQTGQQPMTQMVRGSELLNRNVRDTAGQAAGEIEDVVVNMTDGEIRYAVISFSQGWFQPDQLVAVPIAALGRSAQHPNDVMVSASRQQLENAPVFNRDRWPNFRDEQYQSAWNRFMDQFRAGGGATGAAGGQVTGGMQQPAMQQPGVQQGTQQPGVQQGTQPATGPR